MNKKGHTIVVLVVYGAIGTILMTSMMRMMSGMGKMERGITSNLDLTELVASIRNLIDRKNICDQSTLIGLNVAPLLNTQTTVKPVSVSLKAGSSSRFQAGTAFDSRKIKSLQLTKLQSLGVGREYLATLLLQTTIVGKAMTSRSPAHDFTVPVTLDAKNIITSCGSGDADPSPTPTATPNPSPSCVPKDGAYCPDTCPDGKCVRAVGKLVAQLDGTIGCNGNWNSVHWSGTVNCPKDTYLIMGGVNCQVPGAYKAGEYNYIPGGILLTSAPDSSAPFRTWKVDCCGGRPHDRPNNCEMCTDKKCSPTPNCDSNRPCGFLKDCSPGKDGGVWGDATSGYPITALCMKY